MTASTNASWSSGVHRIRGRVVDVESELETEWNSAAGIESTWFVWFCAAWKSADDDFSTCKIWSIDELWEKALMIQRHVFQQNKEDLKKEDCKRVKQISLSLRPFTNWWNDTSIEQTLADLVWHGRKLRKKVGSYQNRVTWCIKQNLYAFLQKEVTLNNATSFSRAIHFLLPLISNTMSN